MYRIKHWTIFELFQSEEFSQHKEVIVNVDDTIIFLNNYLWRQFATAVQCACSEVIYNFNIESDSVTRWKWRWGHEVIDYASTTVRFANPFSRLKIHRL
jgi:hypothetical protein